jgi:hypothetical protein
MTETPGSATGEVRAQGTDGPPTHWQWFDVPMTQRFQRLSVPNMAPRVKVLIGLVWLPLVGIGSLVGLLWSYPLAERAQAGQGTTVAVQWFGPDFHGTPTTTVLLAMAFAASCGSAIQVAAVFAARAGNQTLERGYGAWYYMRPATALVLGPLFGLAMIGGLSAITSGSGGGTQVSLPTLVTGGTVAGLFTDWVLREMGRIVGLPSASQTSDGAVDPDHFDHDDRKTVTTTPAKIRDDRSSEA